MSFELKISWCQIRDHYHFALDQVCRVDPRGARWCPLAVWGGRWCLQTGLERGTSQRYEVTENMAYRVIFKQTFRFSVRRFQTCPLSNNLKAGKISVFIFFCFHYSHCGVQITSHFYTWILFPLLFVQWALPEEMPECSTAIFGVWAQSERYPTCPFLCRAPQQLLGNPQICLLRVSSEPSSHRSLLTTGCLLLCWHPRWTIERSQQSDAPGPEL